MTVLRRTLLVLIVLFPLIAFAQADQAIVSVVDAPDPVIPGQTLTYTITFQNNGPNPAVNGGVNILLDANFTPTAATPPAGFSCTPLTQIMSCTSPSFAPGGPQVLTITGTVAAHLNNFPDGTLSSTFTTSGVTPDPNNANNSSGVIVTAYNTPQIDLQIAVADSPDPVFPDGNITYTIDVTNAGPDAATSVNFNSFNSGTLRYQSITIPSGWSCPSQPPVNGTPTFTCTNPSFAMGTSQFIVVVKADDDVLGIADGSVSTHFSVNGTGDDTNDLNNGETESTAYVTPDADIQVTVSDSPDPVFPDGDITYTVSVQNAGPDTAPNVTLNVPMNNTLRFQSVTVPAGWSCTPPAVGAGTSWSCTIASLPVQPASIFTIVLRANDEQFGINDGTINQFFGANSGITDPNNSNNGETEATAYVTPDADIQVTVSDSPDPVFPDGDITYTVSVQNAGPDTAPNVTLNVPMNNTLRFQSVTVPAGWSCTPPAVGAGTSWSCTIASLPMQPASVFTIVLRANDEQFGINDGTINQFFGANSGISDPNNANNGETEATAYVTPDADIQVTVADSPDPVFPDGDITYTVSVQNAGPDTAPNVTLNVPMNNTLRFQSVTVPAGWSCTPPAVGAGTSWSCTIASLPMQPASVFTIVLRANDEQFGINDQTINQFFGANSSIADPNNANNGETEATSYVTPDANVSITATDSPDPVVNGAILTYVVDVANGGPHTGSNASVILSPHPSLLFQSLVSPAGWSCTTPAVDAAGVVQCTKASIANAETAQFTLTTKLVTAGSGGTLDSDFSISTSAQDPTPANNSVEVLTTWIGQSSDLAIDKTTLSNAAAQGSTITYTISTVNNGPDAASNVTVTDVLPPSLLFQSLTAPAGWNCTTPAAGTNGTITCTLAVFPNGATATFTLVATVAPNATGSISNSATIGSSVASDPNGGNSSGSSSPVVVAGNADLEVSKTTTATDAEPGDTISYTVEVTNNGPEAAASAVMTDTLPASLLFQSITTPSGWNCVTPSVGATGTITCTANTLANGATSTFTINTTVAAGATGTIANTASASHSGSDSNAGNSSETTPPLPVIEDPSANLGIAKTTTATTVTVGTVFTYTITVSNAGPATATNVVVNDTLPAQLELVSATPSQGTCNAVSPVVCNLGSILNGGNATITLQVRAIAAGGSVVNSATVVSAESDPAGGDNADDAPTIIVIGGPAGEEDIPTLSEWMLIALMGMLGLVAVFRMRT